MKTIQELVDLNLSGTDILHGELKNMLYQADVNLGEAMKLEQESDFMDSMISMDRTYAEGYMDALVSVNQYIIDLTYAIEERKINEHHAN